MASPIFNMAFVAASNFASLVVFPSVTCMYVCMNERMNVYMYIACMYVGVLTHALVLFGFIRTRCFTVNDLIPNALQRNLPMYVCTVCIYVCMYKYVCMHLCMYLSVHNLICMYLFMYSCRYE